jgi:hypothetical protein
VNSTFIWKHEQTGTELLTMIEDDYGKEIDVPASSLKASIVQAKAPADGASGGANDEIALVFLYTVDNTGPPTAEQVSAFWSNLQQRHPKASIVASSLDAFAAEVLSGNTAELQTVTEELGDSWLYGAPADPIKVATFRCDADAPLGQLHALHGMLLLASAQLVAVQLMTVGLGVRSRVRVYM